MSIKYVQSNTLYLAGSGIIIGAVSIVLTSLTDIYGNVLTMTDFGAKGYITLEPDTTNEEGATFTGITANANGTYTLTGISTILAKSPYTETSGLVRAHSGGTKIVITDNVAFWNTFGNKQNDETIIGRWGSAVVPSANNDYVNKSYADGLAIAGAPNASTTVKGIGEVSVAPVSTTTPIFVGDNDPRVPTQGENDSLVGNNIDIAVGTGNKMVTQTGLIHNAETFAVDASTSSTAYTAVLTPIPTSLTNGMMVRVKIGLANTTTTPTLNVNSLGAKTIVKLVSTALAISDISAGMYCTFVYDLTNTVWILQTPIANLIQNSAYKNGVTSRSGSAASGSQTIAHGLGVIPKYVRFTARKGANGIAATGAKGDEQSVGTYNGTTTATVWSLFASTGGTGTNAAASGTDTTNIILITDDSSLGATQQAATATFDATNITLTWVKSGSPVADTINIIWEAFA